MKQLFNLGLLPLLLILLAFSSAFSQNKTIEAEKLLVGKWVGDMGDKSLVIVISEVTEERVLIGYNILGTNQRPIQGYYSPANWDQPCSFAFDATLKEPATDKWDGVFTIQFIGYLNEVETDEGLECEEGGGFAGFEAFGEWKSNNGQLDREFGLNKE